MNTTNLTTTVAPIPDRRVRRGALAGPRPAISLAGLVAAVPLLAGCTQLLNLDITNACGQDVAVGIEGAVESSLDGWYPVSDGTEFTVSVDGFDEVLITVVPAGADEIFDHTEIDLDYLETTTTNGQDHAKLDLNKAGLCS